MSAVVYIIYSSLLDQYNIGHSENLEDRLFRHNNSGSKYTKRAGDWKLVYSEELSNKAEASKREIQIKRKKSKKYIQWLIAQDC
jgi:putative endonuclease